jgi:Mor family transcriptional regulator
MARRKTDCQNIALDIVDACHGALDRNTAIKGVRNLCRYFGGAMYYIPVKKKDGRTVKEMYETLREAVGDRGADIIIDKTMALFGGLQIYIPLERSAFENVIAEEIYKRHTEENANMLEMSRDYGFSFTKIYGLWKKGQKIKLRKELKKRSLQLTYCRIC